MKPSDKRKFLIVASDDKRIKKISTTVQSQISKCQLYVSKDGIDALSKIKNDPPHVLIVERNISKLSGIELVQSVFASKDICDVAVILISEIPDKEHFVDEVVIGKVQFLHDIQNQEAFAKALAKAMNFASHGDNAEFVMKFLAKGELLLKEGDKADNVYVVKHGKLQAFTNQTGSPVILGAIEEGQFVGEMAYINGEPRSASVVASTDCELIEIPVAHLDHILFQKPAWSKALFKTLSQRVKIANELKKAVHQGR